MPSLFMNNMYIEFTEVYLSWRTSYGNNSYNTHQTFFEKELLKNVDFVQELRQIRTNRFFFVNEENWRKII